MVACGSLVIRRGLSPLARGTHCFALELDLRQRFIPAGAGNSTIVLSISQHSSVYPRWRGELVSDFADFICKFGLSPLARGTLQLGNTYGKADRFIPAGAGNSDLTGEIYGNCTVYPRWRGELN